MSDWEPLQSLIDNAAITDHNNEVAARTVLNYWRDMNAVEKRYADYEHKEFGAELDTIIAAKTDVHNRYWAKSDDDY